MSAAIWFRLVWDAVDATGLVRRRDVVYQALSASQGYAALHSSFESGQLSQAETSTALNQLAANVAERVRQDAEARIHPPHGAE